MPDRGRGRVKIARLIEINSAAVRAEYLAVREE
jgi:hypothetical protein